MLQFIKKENRLIVSNELESVCYIVTKSQKLIKNYARLGNHTRWYNFTVGLDPKTMVNIWKGNNCKMNDDHLEKLEKFDKLALKFFKEFY